MEEQKKEGIELLKKFAKTAINTTEEVREDLNDGKISTGEIIGLADNVISLARQGLNWKGLLSEIKDLDTDEGKEMAQYLIESGIASYNVEIIILHIAALAEKIYIAYMDDIVPIIAAIKK